MVNDTDDPTQPTRQDAGNGHGANGDESGRPGDATEQMLRHPPLPERSPQHVPGHGPGADPKEPPASSTPHPGEASGIATGSGGEQ